MQAESKEALAEVLRGQPHFMTPDGSIEIVDLAALVQQIGEGVDQKARSFAIVHAE